MAQDDCLTQVKNTMASTPGGPFANPACHTCALLAEVTPWGKRLAFLHGFTPPGVNPTTFLFYLCLNFILGKNIVAVLQGLIFFHIILLFSVSSKLVCRWLVW